MLARSWVVTIHGPLARRRVTVLQRLPSGIAIVCSASVQPELGGRGARARHDDVRLERFRAPVRAR